MTVAGMAHALEPLGEALRARRAFAQAVEAAQDPAATEGHEADTLALPWPPPHGISRGNVEVHAPGPGAIEDEPAVHLEEREMRADEDRVIRGVLDVDLGHAPARIDHDGPVPEEDLARPHHVLRAGAGAGRPGPMAPSTWRMRIPSPKRHSIFTVPTRPATPSSTSSAVRTLCPTRITSS